MLSTRTCAWLFLLLLAGNEVAHVQAVRHERVAIDAFTHMTSRTGDVRFKSEGTLDEELVKEFALNSGKLLSRSEKFRLKSTLKRLWKMKGNIDKMSKCEEKTSAETPNFNGLKDDFRSETVQAYGDMVAKNSKYKPLKQKDVKFSDEALQEKAFNRVIESLQKGLEANPGTFHKIVEMFNIAEFMKLRLQPPKHSDEFQAQMRKAFPAVTDEQIGEIMGLVDGVMENSEGVTAEQSEAILNNFIREVDAKEAAAEADFVDAAHEQGMKVPDFIVADSADNDDKLSEDDEDAFEAAALKHYESGGDTVMLEKKSNVTRAQHPHLLAAALMQMSQHVDGKGQLAAQGNAELLTQFFWTWFISAAISAIAWILVAAVCALAAFCVALLAVVGIAFGLGSVADFTVTWANYGLDANFMTSGKYNQGMNDWSRRR